MIKNVIRNTATISILLIYKKGTGKHFVEINFGRKISTKANSGYPKVAVQWLNQALYLYQSSCLVDGEVLFNPLLLKHAKRQTV